MGILTKNIEIKENLDEYLFSLKDDDIKWSIRENRHYADEFGLQVSFKVNEEDMQKAAKTPVAPRYVQGVHTYDMLKNPSYADYFQYVSCHNPN